MLERTKENMRNGQGEFQIHEIEEEEEFNNSDSHVIPLRKSEKHPT